MDNCRTIFHVNLWLKVDVALININLYRLIHSSNSNLGGDISTPLITALDLDPLLKWGHQPRPLCSKLIVINLRYVLIMYKSFLYGKMYLDVFINEILILKDAQHLCTRQNCFTNFLPYLIRGLNKIWSLLEYATYHPASNHDLNGIFDMKPQFFDSLHYGNKGCGVFILKGNY